jgi:hypothetical protein
MLVTPSVFRRLGICRCNVLTLNRQQPGFRGVAYHFPGTTNRYIVVRLPALKQINFGLSPVPYRGNVVARVNCSGGYLVITNFIWKPPTALSSMLISISPNPFLKTFQWSRYYPKVFEKHFQKFFLSVPILEFFGSTSGIPRALLLTKNPLLQG